MLGVVEGEIEMDSIQRRLFLEIPLTFFLGVVSWEALAFVLGFVYGIQMGDAAAVVYAATFFGAMFLLAGVVLTVPVCVLMLFSEVNFKVYLLTTFLVGMVLGILGLMAGGEFMVLPAVAAGHILTCLALCCVFAAMKWREGE